VKFNSVLSTSARVSDHSFGPPPIINFSPIIIIVIIIIGIIYLSHVYNITKLGLQTKSYTMLHDDGLAEKQVCSSRLAAHNQLTVMMR